MATLLIKIFRQSIPALILAAGSLFSGCSDSGPLGSDKAWYYNTQTRQFFVDQAHHPSPFVNESGVTCFRAIVLVCPGGEPYLGWVEKDPEPVSDSLESLPMPLTSSGDGRWHILGSDGAEVLVNKAMTQCGAGIVPAKVAPVARP